jgi:hypothetical protein
MRFAKVVLMMMVAWCVGGCGSEDSPVVGWIEAGKGEGEPQKVTWSDGGTTAGYYVQAWVQWWDPDYAAKKNNMPPDEEALYWPSYPYSDGYYLIHAWPAEPPNGHLGFHVVEGFRLGVDQLNLEVWASAPDEGFGYDLVLLKSYREGSEDKHHSVVIPLSDTLYGGGRTITRAQAPALIDALRGNGDAPDRAGFAGTWKVVAVPRNGSVSADVSRQGAPEVKIHSVRIMAAPDPEQNPWLARER